MFGQSCVPRFGFTAPIPKHWMLQYRRICICIIAVVQVLARSTFSLEMSGMARFFMVNAFHLRIVSILAGTFLNCFGSLEQSEQSLALLFT